MRRRLQRCGSLVGLQYALKVCVQDMYTFLQLFFAMYPQYKGLDFYIFGESYAGMHMAPAICSLCHSHTARGHYVPAICSIVNTNNQNLKPNQIKLNLVRSFPHPIAISLAQRGCAVGNGLVDPLVQVRSPRRVGLSLATVLAVRTVHVRQQAHRRRCSRYTAALTSLLTQPH